MLSTPIALIIFNRPETTKQVFEQIVHAKPRTFFVIADGPRPDHPEDVEKCAATRAIVEKVDWPCDLVKNYSEVNLGCGVRPATGITRVFEHVDQAIILEDDCVPHPSFFRFCHELLEKYRDDERVMMISGRNNWDGSLSPYSYYFAYHHSNWGWATWRRAWQHFDMRIKAWPALRETSWLQDILEYPAAVELWRRIFDKAHGGAGEVDFWDYQWTFALWSRFGLAITPKVNLITNIGFGEGASHTKSRKDFRAELSASAACFPLVHPPFIVRAEDMDRVAFSQFSRGASSAAHFLPSLRAGLSRLAPVPLLRLWRGLRGLVRNRERVVALRSRNDRS